jgi:uncharacterized protein HemX
LLKDEVVTFQNKNQSVKVIPCEGFGKLPSSTNSMKKIMLILAAAAIACSPLFVSQAQASPGKSHKAVHKKAGHQAKHLAKHQAKHLARHQAKHFARQHKAA